MTARHFAFLQQHLLQALQHAPDEARRLFHGRGRCWPGLEQLNVDWLQGILLVSLFRAPAPDELENLQALLLDLSKTPQWQACGGHSLLLQHRYLAQCPMHCLHGEPVQHWIINENGLRYQLDLGGKQNTGFFLDMRLGRQWVRQHANGKRVLNLFAYTCGFSVAAIAGGATQVINLDMARSALNRGRDNHRLNDQDLSRVELLGHELFKSWAKLRRHGPYDLIIIDPPSFQKGSFILERDYPKILRRLPELLSAQGQVMACLNAPGTGSTYLLNAMAQEAPRLKFSQRLENPAEFPDIDAQAGLKVLLFELAANSTVQA
jgi:23S rRNA (cytosine1962-C5)-methyltransferase